MNDDRTDDAAIDAAGDAATAPKRVVGLRYSAGDALPVVLLKGAGPLAGDLLQRGSGRPAPPVVHNPTLLDALYRLPVDAAIGPELFQAVAAILAHVLAVDASQRGGHLDG